MTVKRASVEPSIAGAGAHLVVTVELAGDADGLPGVYWETSAGRVTATHEPGAGGGVLRYGYDVTGAEPEGIYPVLIDVIGADGGALRGLRGESVTFDFSPAAIIGSTVSAAVEPPPESLVSIVRAMADGATAQILFAVTEPLGELPVVTAGDADGSLLSFEVNLIGGTFYEAVCSLGPDDRVADGPLAVTARLTDLAGNVAEHAIDVDLVVDRSAPLPPDVELAGAVTYLRRPWGSQQFTGPTMSIRLVAGAVEPDATVVAYSSDGANSSELGRQAGTTDGGGELGLLAGDRPHVFVATIDGAGNASPVVRVRDVEWTASFRGKAAGDLLGNPHRAEAHPYFVPWRDPVKGVAVRELDGERLAQEDGSVESVAAAGAWYRRLSRPRAPCARSGSGSAYDAARGVVVLHGGNTGVGPCDALGITGFASDTWEWDGTEWREIVVVDLGGDGEPPAAPGRTLYYDAKKARVRSADGWEWDGREWHPTSVPPVPTGCVPQFHAARGRLQCAGDAAFELQDGGWIEVAGPAHATLAYDHAREVMVGLVSGATGTETWEQDVSGWRLVETIDPEGPPPDANGGMTWDPATGHVLVAASPSWTLWAYDGAGWARAPAVDPEGDGDPSTCAGLVASALVAHPPSLRTVLYGGVCNNITDATWEWDGASWRRVQNGAVVPPPAVGGALAFDAARSRTVLFGGDPPSSVSLLDDVYEWDGRVWRQPVPTDPESDGNPNARQDASMVFDSARQVVLLFGGSTATNQALNDTWEWNGVSWRRLLPSDPEGDGNPTSNVLLPTPMAYDEERHVAVLLVADTWEWNGTSWRNAGPLPDLGLPMAAAYDTSQQLTTVVMSGGVSVWDGLEWSILTTGAPPAGEVIFASDRRAFLGLDPVGAFVLTSSTWEPEPVADPHGRGVPSLRSWWQSPMSWDDGRQRGVFVDAEDLLNPSGEVWELESGAAAKPALLARFSIPSAQIDPGAVLRELRLTSAATGSLGTTLSVWRGSAWQLVDSGIDGSLVHVSDDDATIRAFITRGDITYAVSSLDRTFDVDAIELQLAYRLP